ncbi:MAG TPA: GntR family transcriptional regulator [Kofleriaceae bacterium]|jgi:DNA-binding GntR family transcriptional regulator|nr:GntR family transcriptional regulator [Kofleriaceae bacterium]
MSDALATIAQRLRSAPRHVEGGNDALHDLVVVPALREAIINNLLAPGERLTEVALAARLGVSRTPVREAFSQLEREGLVTVLPRVGVFVREVTARDVEETYTVRAALEALAVELATQRRTPLGTAQLDAVLADMAAAVGAANEVEYTAALDRFYAVVMALADNATLQATHHSLLGPVRRLRRIAMTHPGRMESSYAQSVRIRDAIASGDPRGPELMREQLHHGCRAAMAALNAGR